MAEINSCFFLNGNDGIHISIPSSWDKNKEIHVTFDEDGKHYRYYRSIEWSMKKGFAYYWSRTVVVRDGREHNTTFTPDQYKKCENISVDFKLLHDNLHLWRCDETNQEHTRLRSPCRTRTRSPTPENAWNRTPKSRSRSRSPLRR